ncbi:putative aldouronate transport system substrate-binding protein [Paenibacillus rhizosphaerae]|uniref:Putative aldouronate transport system substrate-binding protein n=1 Tax=Paenibacillus rhizosphaerae TaxID=297318 RepID=A0A839TG02_9BACL|nr:extracellular solute-binding protein [Paenibacillus rhizosphaerae]MBB3125484.1 putative aldouronate transport system substrate-binding protein [Paenibacillus rhizosphaerae]
MKKRFAAILLVFILILTACSDQTEKNESDSEPSGQDQNGQINIQFGAAIDPNMEQVGKLEKKTGETLENNRWTKLFSEKNGVTTQYKLMAPQADYTQKLKLSIASGDLPDIFVVSDKADLKQLAEGGAIQEMGPIYDQYASPLLKSIIEAETKKVFDQVTYGGKIYGIPAKMPSTNGYNHLWIREDWLQKLGLKRPKTMDDVYNIAVAFAKQDPDGNGKADTFGLGLHKDFLNGMKGIFWGYKAYPEFWYKNDSGQIVFGSVQPEMKKPLELLAKMYSEGLVDHEFGSKDEAKMLESVVAGKTGMIYAPHWTAYSVEKTMENDPNCKWIVVPLPTDGSDPIQIPLSNSADGAYVVNKDFKHPEKLVEMLNTYVDALFGENADFNKYWSDGDIDSVWAMSPIHTLDPSLDLKGHQDIKKALANNTTDQLTGVAKGFYKTMQDGVWGMSMMFGPKDTPFAFVDQTYPDQVIWSEFEGAPTPTMATNWSSMSELLNTEFTAMVQGKKNLDSDFDKMVQNWNNLGGKNVLEEVNAQAINK